jgi:hypothetical protein
MVSSIADLTDMITADASSDGLTVKNCEFRDGGASLEVVAMIDIATTVDDVTIDGCRFFSTDTNDAGLAGIRFAGTGARPVITNNYFRGDFNTAAILASAGALTDIFIAHNIINNIDAAADNNCISMNASATGAIWDNHMHTGKSNAAPQNAAACLQSENYATDAEASSTNLIPDVGDWEA